VILCLTVFIATLLSRCLAIDRCCLIVALIAFSQIIIPRIMSVSRSGKRNVIGEPSEARRQLDRIQDPTNGYWTPPSHHSRSQRHEDRADTSVDRRTNSKGRSVVLAEYTREGLQLLWDLSLTNLRVEECDRSIDPKETCWIWTSYKPVKGGKGGKHDLSIPPFSDELGYPVIQRGHGLAKIKVHQLAVWKRDGTFIEHGMNASHLCHQPACMNPAHLRGETITLNRLRQGCPCWRWLDVQMTVRVNICTHGDPDNGQPFCLRPDIKGIEDRGDVWDPTSAGGWRKNTANRRKREREVISLDDDIEDDEEPPAIERSDDGFYYDRNGDRILG